MSDVVVTVAPANITVEFPVSLPTNNEEWLNNLPEYDSDDAAIADGILVGGWYKTTDDHVAVAGGVAKQVT